MSLGFKREVFVVKSSPSIELNELKRRAEEPRGAAPF